MTLRFHEKFQTKLRAIYIFRLSLVNFRFRRCFHEKNLKSRVRNLRLMHMLFKNE